MTRIGFGSILVGFGYLLAYAAVFNGGHYASRPWKAIGA